MIFVQGSVVLNAEDVPAMASAASKMMAATLKEEGCLHYSFALDVSNNSKIHISERWKDEASLEAHFQTTHMNAFNAAMSDWSIKSMDIRMYSGEEIKVMMQS